MGQLANVEYFYLKCNKILGTSYTVSDWHGVDNGKRPINIEWVCLASQKVYQHIHQPKSKTTDINNEKFGKDYGCTLKLSNRLKNKISKLAVDDVFVNEVVDYLSGLNKICDNDCACYRSQNCACVCTIDCATFCSGPPTCSGRTVSGNNCVCTCKNCECNCTPDCACECGSYSECDCDCHPYDCNCFISSKNCDYGEARPKTKNCNYTCGQCQCNCTCDPVSPPDETVPCPSDRCTHRACQQCCSGLNKNCWWTPTSWGFTSNRWLGRCTYCSQYRDNEWINMGNSACPTPAAIGENTCSGSTEDENQRARRQVYFIDNNCPTDKWWCCGEPYP